MLNLSLINLSKALYVLKNPQLIKPALNGLVVDTYQQLNNPWFHNLKIDTVIDIGANIGRTVVTFNELLPKARIHAFEPLPNCYEQLCKRTSQLTNCSTYNIALGANKDKLKMNLSSHNPSSSLLTMSQLHSQAFPFTADSTEVLVDIIPLDDLKIDTGNSLLIKLDVQGYEDIVISGGLETFSKAKIIVLEVSYEPLYENQVLFDGIYSIMSKLNFKFAGTLGNLKDPRTGKIIEADAIFMRNQGVGKLKDEGNNLTKPGKPLF
jgi:FkbM family methyltransferase